LISGASSPAKTLRAIQDKRIIHLVSDLIMEEYLRVLEYPRIRKFEKITDAFVADIAAYLIYQTEGLSWFRCLAAIPLMMCSWKQR